MKNSVEHTLEKGPPHELPRMIFTADRPRTPEEKALFENMRQQAAALEHMLEYAFSDKTAITSAKVCDRQRRRLLLSIAESARTFSWNHRGFNVGAAAICLTRGKSGSLAWKVLFAANSMNEKHHVAKCCAEQEILMRFEKENVVRLLALAVAGPNQEDDESGKRHHALTPCKFCRDALWMLTTDTPPRTDASMRVYMQDIENRKKSTVTLEKLHALHAEEYPTSR